MSSQARAAADAAAVKEAEQSLGDLREGLVQDGYDFQLSMGADSVLEVALVAQPDACAECLVPKEVMVTILESSLPETVRSRGWRLAYPSDR
jgi:hypothetical protein